MRIAALVFAALSLAPPAIAQDWGIGAGTGGFLFGDLVRIRSEVETELEELESEQVLSAATRAGGQIHLARFLGERWSIRADATFVRSPLSLETESDGDGGLVLEAGDLDVTTVSLAAAFRFNGGGNLRPLIFAGPVWASYKIRPDEATGAPPIFRGSRQEWGGVLGAGLEWWISDRFAIRAEISDIVTTSPFRKEDFASVSPGDLEINETHNIHTVAGVMWRF